MQTLIDQMVAAMEAIKADIHNTENKSAMARVRKNTLVLEKLGKVYRMETCKK